MIKRLIDRILTRTSRNGVRKRPKKYRASDRGMPIDNVSQAAIRTCETLQQGGFQAWIVGGGVRDLMLGLKPKDFDVATDATPDQVRRLFRRSRIIGRRFQIVHVLYGRDTIEVSTFRSMQPSADTDEHGRVLRDNVWGTHAEDAARRDFTINALYYDPVSDVLLDFHDGVKDMEKRTLRMIGDPVARYREDPVRMLRVARFAAKLGFTVEPKTKKPIRELTDLIHNVPSARLFDEMLKLLLSGHAMACLQELRREGLHHGLLPMLDVILEQPDDERFVNAALAATDARVLADKTLSPGFLFAALLWQPVRIRWQAAVSGGEHAIPALAGAIDSVLDEQAERIAIQRRFIGDMREIWMTQPRFERRTGRSPHALVAHPRFRAAYDFLLLRCESGEAPAELGQWWTAFAAADSEERQAMLERAPGGAAAARRKRRGRDRGASQSSEDEVPEAAWHESAITGEGTRSAARRPSDAADDRHAAGHAANEAGAEPAGAERAGAEPAGAEPLERKPRRRRRRPQAAMSPSDASGSAPEASEPHNEAKRPQ